MRTKVREKRADNYRGSKTLGPVADTWGPFILVRLQNDSPTFELWVSSAQRCVLMTNGAKCTCRNDVEL